MSDDLKAASAANQPRMFYATAPCGCVIAAQWDRSDDREAIARSIGHWYLRGLTINQREGPVAFTKCKTHGTAEAWSQLLESLAASMRETPEVWQ